MSLQTHKTKSSQQAIQLMDIGIVLTDTDWVLASWRI